MVEDEEGTGKKIVKKAGSVISFFGNEEANRNAFSYGVIGIIFGAIIGFFLSAVTGLQPILSASVIAVGLGLVGAIMGFVLGLMTPGAANFLKGIGLIIFLLGLSWFAYLYIYTGMASPIVGEFNPAVEEYFVKIGESTKCILPWNFKDCWWESFYKDWGSERQEEEVSLKINFETTNILDIGKDEEILAEIEIINKPDEGVDRFTIEPECYIGDEKVDSESSGYKEDGKLTFLTRETTQIASIKCVVPASLIEDKESIKAKIKLRRPVKSSVDWTATTLSSDKISELSLEGKSIPGEGNVKGKVIRYSGIPYSFGIGVKESLPLSEGEHHFRIELVRQAGLRGELKKIKYLSVSGNVGETAQLSTCEGLKYEGDDLVLKKELVKTETEDIESIFSCILEVEPEDDPNQIVFDAEIEYEVDIEKERSIIIFREKGEA